MSEPFTTNSLHKNQAWWEARLGKHHEGTMPCSGNCRHERVSRVSSWKCRGVWPIPFGAAFAAWNGPSSEPWLIYMSKFMKYFFGGNTWITLLTKCIRGCQVCPRLPSSQGSLLSKLDHQLPGRGNTGWRGTVKRASGMQNLDTNYYAFFLVWTKRLKKNQSKFSLKYRYFYMHIQCAWKKSQIRMSASMSSPKSSWPQRTPFLCSSQNALLHSIPFGEVALKRICLRVSIALT